MKTKKLYSDYPIPPGEYLKEVIEELEINTNELAKRMNSPISMLSAIFNGDQEITQNIALQLEKILGVPNHIWQGLESDYRITLMRQKEQLGKINYIQPPKFYSRLDHVSV